MSQEKSNSTDEPKKEFKGIRDDLTNEEYHAEKEHLSSSNLKQLLKDPADFYDKKILGNHVQEKKNVFDEGSLAHCYILEPHMHDVDFVIFDGFRKAGKVWEAFKSAEESGLNRTILSKPQQKRVQNWVKGYELNKTAVELIAPCKSELSLFGEMDGVKIKVRADSINIEEGYIGDVKTTAYDTDVESFKDTVEDFGYDLSACLYAEMFEQHFGKPFDFYFIVLGKKDCSCEVFRLSEASRKKGRKQIKKALALYKQCMKSGVWETKKKEEFLGKTYDNYEILDV